jgi:hypothetical protein
LNSESLDGRLSGRSLNWRLDGMWDLRIHYGGFFTRIIRAIDGDFELVDGRFDKGHRGQRNGRRYGLSRYCRRSFLLDFTRGSSGRFIGGFDGGFFRGTSG